MNDLQQFIFLSKYARYDWKEGRRETWEEAIERVMTFLKKSSDNLLPVDIYEQIQKGLVNMDAICSMRLLNQAGNAATYNGLGVFNCAYIPITSAQSFADLTYSLLSGTGNGLSVEKENIQQLGIVKSYTGNVLNFEVPDSSEGWADTVFTVIHHMMLGMRVSVDYNYIRPAGEPLMTKGGVSAGPAPLRNTIREIKMILEYRRGLPLRPIDAYDIACWIANGVVSGGNRRSALLTAFSWDDEEMAKSKTEDWFQQNPQRRNSNNSVVIPPDYEVPWLIEFITNMLDSESGEPGIINPSAYWQNMPKARRNLTSRAEVERSFRTNPCGEVILRPYQTCNLSMAINRADDSYITTMRKVTMATILGVLQADITNLQYVSDEWHNVLDKERILGVSLTGFAECKYLHDGEFLSEINAHATYIAEEYSEILGMDAPTAITTIKPSGNSSLLYGTGSGVHAWHAPYFLRNTMVKNGSPLQLMLQDQGVPMTKMISNEEFSLVHFPVKAPDGAVTRNDVTAIEQVERWLNIQDNYADHAVSATITYEESEKEDILYWLIGNIDKVTGLSFLKKDDSVFTQMPIEEITEDEYNKRISQWPNIDWGMLGNYENTDMTESSGEIACSAGVCEVDFTNTQEVTG